MKSKLTTKQVKTLPWKEYTEGGRRYRIKAELRYDDKCGNGHNTFSITGETQFAHTRGWHEDSSGCIHRDIEKHYPELKKVIKWHLTSSDGPMHYIANTCYHASNRDCNGLLEGESRQIINGRTKKPYWILEKIKGDDLPRYINADEAPISKGPNTYVPLCRVGEGKVRNFKAARGCAVWPRATIKQLSLPKEELTVLLNNRLPKLLRAFKKDMESLGFTY